MTSEEHLQIVQEIAQNLTDQAKVTELLNNLSTDYGETLVTNSTLSADNEKIKTDNEALRNANMKLFLQVGEKPTIPPNPTIPPELEKPVTPEPTKFENLFNEKGELK